MGTTLTGTTPQDTYDSLIKVTDNGPIGATAKYLSDGLGNDSVLALSNARVGVGTNTPQAPLEVKGSLGIRVDEAGTGSNVLTLRSDFAGAGPAVNVTSNSPLLFLTNNTERLRITSTGNVGIGTSSPSSPLTVYKATSPDVDIQNSSALHRITGDAGSLLIRADYGNTAANTTIQFSLDGTEVARFTPNGLTFNGDTAAANALDDYEEGTWTPNIIFGGGSTGVIYSGINAGTYTKIGRKVTVNGHLDIANKGTSTGAAQISNLPFTIGSGSGNYGSPSFRPVNISFADMFIGYGDVGGNTITLQEITNAGTISSITDADFATTTNLIFSFTYFV